MFWRAGAVLFEALSFAQWRAIYQGHIRVAVRWDRVKVLRTGVHLRDSTDDSVLYVPVYKGGDFLDGRPVKVRPGTEPVMVRIPALRLYGGGSYFALDGLHRLTELRPRWVALDWIEPTKGSYRYFFDMHNPAWKEILG